MRQICWLMSRAGALSALLLMLANTPASAATKLDDVTHVSTALATTILAERSRVSGSEAIFSAYAKRENPPLSVSIDAIARHDGDRLLKELRALGMRGAERHGWLVSGHMPTHLLDELDGIEALLSARPAGVRFATGAVSTEGDAAMRSDIARADFDVDGEGVTVGVISDSYDCLGGAMADIASGDLPADPRILQDADDCEDKLDEGRALMQIVHDIAPGATLIFRSGANGTAGVANAILDLAQAGADVVIDDAQTPMTSWFQHGPVARAVQQVVAQGVVHVSAAGNEARLSYDSTYRASDTSALGLRAHDFDPGPIDDSLQEFELPEGALLELILQWDDPSFSSSGPPGAASDLDMYVTDESGTELLGAAVTDNSGTDPVEVLTFFNPEGSGRTHFNLLIVTAAGPSPGRLKYIVQGRFAGTLNEHQTESSTIVGHANTTAGITVAAVDHALVTGEEDEPPPLRAFSSAGGTPILFNDAGERYVEPIVTNKPDIAAPDGVSTTFFRNDPDGPLTFIGTSASAPHVAGVVALLLDARDDLAPVDVRALLAGSARDMVAREGDGASLAGPGFDTDSGYGLIDAEAALSLAMTYENLMPEPVATDRPVVRSETISVGGGSIALDCLGVMMVLLVFRQPRSRSLKCDQQHRLAVS